MSPPAPQTRPARPRARALLFSKVPLGGLALGDGPVSTMLALATLAVVARLAYQTATPRLEPAIAGEGDVPRRGRVS